jgi:hypothetical protein
MKRTRCVLAVLLAVLRTRCAMTGRGGRGIFFKGTPRTSAPGQTLDVQCGLLVDIAAGGQLVAMMMPLSSVACRRTERWSTFAAAAGLSKPHFFGFGQPDGSSKGLSRRLTMGPGPLVMTFAGRMTE